jgi:hypothetical protein
MVRLLGTDRRTSKPEYAAGAVLFGLPNRRVQLLVAGMRVRHRRDRIGVSGEAPGEEKILRRPVDVRARHLLRATGHARLWSSSTLAEYVFESTSRPAQK